MVKSSYDIEREMERKFGKDFISKMKSQKTEFERLQKQLEEAKSFEEKVNDKVNALRKNFIYISDNYNIHPDETCSNYLYQFAKKCVEENLSKKEIEDLQKVYEFKVIDDLQESLDVIQKELKRCKEAWENEAE